jgi:hypothetical protein
MNIVKEVVLTELVNFIRWLQPYSINIFNTILNNIM